MRHLMPVGLPRRVELVRRIAFLYLTLFKKFRVLNVGHIPSSGPLIIVANHSAAYDPVCLQVACKNRLIRFMEAREYYDKMPMNLLYRMFRVIPVNRTGNDTASLRTALRELSNNGCVGIFPEGRINHDGRPREARKGVALLALLSNAVVVPAYIHSALPFSGMIRDFLRFNEVTVRFGPPIRFDDLTGRQHKEARDAALKRIMDAIVALQGQFESRIAA